MRIIVTFILLIITTVYQPVIAQRKTKLNTNGQGVLFAQVGYNRSFYSTSNVELSANNYSILLKKASIKDHNSPEESISFFSSESPQISIKVGYFIKPKWALTLSFDRYNTFFEHNQQVVLEGTIAPGTHSEYSGNYNEKIHLTQNQFNISQNKGINYFAVGVQHNDILIKSSKNKFAFHTLYGLKLGGLFSVVDYTFDNYTTQNISSLSGFGAAIEVGFRFEFYQHLYLQAGLNGGILNQNSIRLSDDGAITGKQVLGFISPLINIGFNIFASSKNNCGTCPQW